MKELMILTLIVLFPGFCATAAQVGTVKPIQSVPGSAPADNLQVGPPYNFKPAPKKPKLDVQVQTPPYKPPEGLQTQRDVFGEDNDNPETPYHLPSVNRTYQAAFHNKDDVDWYSFTVPASGLGSWVQITVYAVKPANVGFRRVWVQGPAHGGWETLSDIAHAKLWVALQKGLTGYLGVEPDYGQIIAGGGHLDYNIAIQSGIIPDADTSVDEDGNNWERATVVLTLGEPKQAYMASVGNAAGHETGAWDWFKYNHYQRCKNYCVQLSSKGLIVQQNPDGGSTSDDGAVQRYCLNDNDASADRMPPLWVGIRYEAAGLFSGVGDVPEHYKTPYSITLTEEGPASNTAGCEQ